MLNKPLLEQICQTQTVRKIEPITQYCKKSTYMTHNILFMLM